MDHVVAVDPLDELSVGFAHVSQGDVRVLGDKELAKLSVTLAGYLGYLREIFLHLGPPRGDVLSRSAIDHCDSRKKTSDPATQRRLQQASFIRSKCICTSTDHHAPKSL